MNEMICRGTALAPLKATLVWFQRDQADYIPKSQPCSLEKRTLTIRH